MRFNTLRRSAVVFSAIAAVTLAGMHKSGIAIAREDHHAPATTPDAHAPAAAAASTASADVSPDDALKRLTEGNDRFTGDSFDHPRLTEDRRCDTFANGQHPFATILSCSDSRAPVELLFDQGIGDLFVVRVAGNVADNDEIGTIEYGVGHLHTPLVVVMGHTKCGAVTAVVDGTTLPKHIAALVDNIQPAADRTKSAYPNLHGTALITAAVKANVFQSIQDMLAGSPELREAVSSCKVKIVGAMYDLHSGDVKWLGEHPQQSALLAGTTLSDDELVKPAPADDKHASSKSTSHGSDAAASHPAASHDAKSEHAKPAQKSEGDEHGATAATHDKSNRGHDQKAPKKTSSTRTPRSDDVEALAPAKPRGDRGYLIPSLFLAGSACLTTVVLYTMKRAKAGSDTEPPAVEVAVPTTSASTNPAPTTAALSAAPTPAPLAAAA